MPARKHRQRRTLECVLGVSNEREHRARPETEQQKSPLTNQLERRPDRTQSIDTALLRATSEPDSDRINKLFFCMRGLRDAMLRALLLPLFFFCPLVFYNLRLCLSRVVSGEQSETEQARTRTHRAQRGVESKSCIGSRDAQSRAPENESTATRLSKRGALQSRQREIGNVTHTRAPCIRPPAPSVRGCPVQPPLYTARIDAEPAAI